MSSLLLLALLAQSPADAGGAASDPVDFERLGGAGLSTGEAMAAQKIGETLSTAEFLGPLAPVALSPFFGVACLSGMAQFGPDSLGSNAMLAETSPLRSPWVLGIFALLALLTSLPRLTKVSKPIAGALDQIESWSGIITMLVVKFSIGGEAGDEMALASQTVQVAGIGSVSIEIALAIAAGVNMFVVSAVRFFFEFLIWVTPIPFLDACFEAANKALCAGLLAVYAFSPTLSLGLNLLLFAVSLLVFLKIKRQVTFFRTMLFGWLLGWVREPSPRHLGRRRLVVFPKRAFGPFAARERLLLERTDDGWQLRSAGWLGLGDPVPIETVDPGGQLKPGWAAHTITIEGEVAGEAIGPLLLSRRYRRSLAQLAEVFRLELADEATRDGRQLAVELG